MYPTVRRMKKRVNTEPFTVNLDAHYGELLRKVATQHGTSAATVIRTEITRVLDEYESRELKQAKDE